MFLRLQHFQVGREDGIGIAAAAFGVSECSLLIVQPGIFVVEPGVVIEADGLAHGNPGAAAEVGKLRRLGIVKVVLHIEAQIHLGQQVELRAGEAGTARLAAEAGFLHAPTVFHAVADEVVKRVLLAAQGDGQQ